MITSVTDRIFSYISGLPEAKRNDMNCLHQLILDIQPDCMLWFLDGKNSEGKIVSNPNIGYGHQVLHYADGSTKEFYRVGISANTTGISVYLMGQADKTYLKEKYGTAIGKASVSGYCIKFRALNDINAGVLESAIRYGFGARQV